MIDHLERATVFIDADNTLWDTDAVFADAQLALLTAVESAVGTLVQQVDRLQYLRMIDQAIAKRHHAGLRYPPRLLVRATELALNGMQAVDAARAAWLGSRQYVLTEADAVAIEQHFLADLAKAAQIRPGVADGLQKLKKLGCLLLIVTEDDKVKVKRNAEKLGIARFFSRIVEGQKTQVLYRRVLSLTGAPARAFMIGDQLDRDIAPAKAAGLETIYFPGGFRPHWSPDEGTVQPDHTISSFVEVPAIVMNAVGGTEHVPVVRA